MKFPWKSEEGQDLISNQFSWLKVQIYLDAETDLLPNWKVLNRNPGAAILGASIDQSLHQAEPQDQKVLNINAWNYSYQKSQSRNQAKLSSFL